MSGVWEGAVCVLCVLHGSRLMAPGNGGVVIHGSAALSSSLVPILPFLRFQANEGKNTSEITSVGNYGLFGRETL